MAGTRCRGTQLGTGRGEVCGGEVVPALCVVQCDRLVGRYTTYSDDAAAMMGETGSGGTAKSTKMSK